MQKKGTGTDDHDTILEEEPEEREDSSSEDETQLISDRLTVKERKSKRKLTKPAIGVEIHADAHVKYFQSIYF